MMMKWIGAAMIVVGCGGVGFSMAIRHRVKERSLQELIASLDFMQCELQYRMTPMPDLCRLTAAQCNTGLRRFWTDLARELEDQIRPDVYHCVCAALGKSKDLPEQTEELLRSMGRSLGRFDLDGQVKGLENARYHCRRNLEELESCRDVRIRSYQTLSLCAGAALAILFL